MLSSFLREDASVKVARREHVKVALIVVSSPFYFGKDFEHRKEKKREREGERDVCAVCPTFRRICVISEFWLKFNWPKIDIFLFKIQRSIFGLFSGGVRHL